MSYTNRGATLRMRTMIAERAATGMTSAECATALGDGTTHVCNLLNQAVRKGTLWRLRPAPTVPWLYFASRAAATRYAKANGLQPPPEPPPPKPAAVIEVPRVPAPGSNGPASLPGEPVITPRTRIVRVGAPEDTRFKPERMVRVVDPNECRPWAREVK